MTAKILTTERHNKRLIEAQKEVYKLGIFAHPFYAIDDSMPKISFNKSMMQIMSEHDDVLLLCEDDVEIRNYEHFKKAISELPSDWELCYLGANVIGPVERYSEHLFRITAAWTTHAVMYNNPKKLCKDYKNYVWMFDDWLKEHIQPNGNSYIIAPMMAWQKPHQSDLWDHFADYTTLFNDSANKLI